MLCVIFAQVYKLQFAHRAHHDLKKEKEKRDELWNKTA